MHWLELARRAEADSKRFRCGRITHQQNSIMKGTHVLSRLGDGGGKGNVDVDVDVDQDWAHTWQQHYALRLCTRPPSTCGSLPQHKHSMYVCEVGRQRG